MTEKRISANQANGRRSQGPATREGRERIREANTRHGFYSQAEAVALACLGEDAAELDRLRQNLHDDLQPPSGLEQELVEHLVQVVWRWKRAGRMQEGFALRQAKDVNLTREDRLHAHLMRLKMTEESLRSLAQSVAREYYITPPADLEKMKSLHQEGVMKELGEIALALFYRLEEPGEKDADGRRIDPSEVSRLGPGKDQGDLWSERRHSARTAPGVGFWPATGKPAKSASRRSAGHESGTWRPFSPLRAGSEGRGQCRPEGRRYRTKGGGAAFALQPGGMGGARASAPTSGESPHAAGGDLPGAAQGPAEGVPGGSVALRTRGGNRAGPPQRGADAEDGRIQFSPNLANHQPAAED